MPTYDYRCSECGHTFEEFQAMSAELLTTCPKCGKGSLRRGLGGGAGMIFRGEGFYQTDYKQSGNKKKEADTKKEKVQEVKKSGESTNASPTTTESK